MIKSRFFVVLLVGLMLVGGVSAASWYVDKDASGSNTGASWNDAWQSFSSINWGSISPGDTVYLSDGIYTNTLMIEASGSVGNPIIFRPSSDVGHNGVVEFKGNPDSGVGIKIVDQSWIEIYDFKMSDWYRAVLIDGNSGGGVSNILLDGLYGRMGGRFVFAEGWPDKSGDLMNGLTVRNSRVTTPTDISHQNDFVYVQYARDITINNNYVVISNENTNPHNDHVQTFWVKGPVDVFNNYFEHSDNKFRNSQGIFFENHAGTFRVYNNIIVQPNNNKDGKIYWKSSSLNDAHTIVIGNTIYGSSGDLIKTTDSNAVIKNNILYSTGAISGGTTCMVRGTNGFGSGADIDYNLYYNPDGSMSDICGGSKGSNAISGNPQFVSISSRNFRLKDNSPAIDAGRNLGPPFDIDNDGNTRGSAWDIGPYEFGGSGNFHPADSDQNGCVDLSEIVSYVELWQSGQISLSEVVSGVEQWQQGCQ